MAHDWDLWAQIATACAAGAAFVGSMWKAVSLVNERRARARDKHIEELFIAANQDDRKKLEKLNEEAHALHRKCKQQEAQLYELTEQMNQQFTGLEKSFNERLDTLSKQVQGAMENMTKQNSMMLQALIDNKRGDNS